MNANIRYKNGGTSEVATSTTGSDFVTLPAFRATKVTLFNYTGQKIDWRIDSGSFIELNNNLAVAIDGLVGSQQVSVRRTDLSNTPVTVKFHFAD
jgi:hypothetical protein